MGHLDFSWTNHRYSKQTKQKGPKDDLLGIAMFSLLLTPCLLFVLMHFYAFLPLNILQLDESSETGDSPR
jgi:hypothetical protein